MDTTNESNAGELVPLDVNPARGWVEAGERALSVLGERRRRQEVLAIQAQRGVDSARSRRRRVRRADRHVGWEAAINALIAGPSLADAALALQMPESILLDLLHNPDFVDLYHAAQADTIKGAATYQACARRLAAKRLAECLTSPDNATVLQAVRLAHRISANG